MARRKSLKDALSVRTDSFVEQGTSGSKSTSHQRDKATKKVKPRPVKVTFYWDPQTERGIEQLRLKFLERGKKLTRSEVVEGLVKTALKSGKAMESLL